jgi:hypothetical protein
MKSQEPFPFADKIAIVAPLSAQTNPPIAKWKPQDFNKMGGL